MLGNLWKEFQEIDTSRKALRSFGLLVGLVLVGIASIIFWKHGWQLTTAATGLFGVGGTLIVSGLIAPSLLKPVYRVWMGLAVVMGYVMTRVILTIVFYFVVTPIGILLRISGKDPLRRTWEPDGATYWIDKTYDDESPERLERYY